MKLVFSRMAFRQLSKLEKKVRERISEKLGFYISQKEPLKFAETIFETQFGEWRFRVGDYRVIFDVKGDTIVILKVGHRKDIYK